MKVAACSLDSFVEKNRVKAIDLIKIDVEGSEPEVLEGARNALRKFNPDIICEINYSIDKLQYILNGLGYSAFLIRENWKGTKLLSKCFDGFHRGSDNAFLTCYPNKYSKLIY